MLAADVLYDKMNVGPLVDLVPRLLGEGGQFLLADPRRDYAAKFLEAMDGQGFEQSMESANVQHDSRNVEILLYWLRR